MESDLQQQQHHNILHHHHHHHHHPHHHHQQQSSSLMRNRSAPSSYFTDVLDREFCQQFFDRPSSPETERIFARFMNGDDEDIDPPKPVILNHNHGQSIHSQTNFNHQSFYQSGAKPPLPTASQGVSSTPVSYPLPPMRTGGVANSGLLRQSSSPAGFFANINIDTSVFGAVRGGNNSNSNRAGNEEATGFTQASRLKRTSSMGPMSPIPEVDDKTMITTNNQDSDYVSGFPMDSWDDSAMLPDSFSSLKRIRDDDVKPFSGLNPSEHQNVDGGNRTPMLAHHLSLPKTQSEMAAIEKFLQFQDSVPCKIRAKRGCATHPRSIAERVRRTRISERMRKLQELVPNMEKQTNTSDMLDLAVEYIKDLQNQVQILDDSRAKCTCSNKIQNQQEDQQQ